METDNATPFRNRIIEYGVKPADQFLANPKNARVHPQFQRDVMKAALTEVGFVAPVIESKSGMLLDGHERVWQGLQNNADIPFVVVDVDESEESYVLATFDPITGLATYDNKQLDSLLQEVNSGESAIGQMLGKLAADNNLSPPNDAAEEWQGMPEFEQRTIPHRQLIVHFMTEEDVQAFAELIHQTVTKKTKYIWFPELRKADAKSYRVADES